MENQAPPVDNPEERVITVEVVLTIVVEVAVAK